MGLALFLLLAAVRDASAKARPLLAGRPALAAIGLDEVADLAEYRRAGFNLLWLEASPRKRGEWEISRLRTLIKAASDQGLPVVVHLRLDLLEKVKPSPFDSKYVKACEEFCRSVVSALEGERGIVAWAVGGPVEPPLDNGSFRRLLRELYGGSVAALRAAWRVPVPSFDLVTVDLPARLDRAKPWGVGRPTLDLALCRMALVRRLYSLWVRAVKEADGKGRPVVLGPVRHARDLPLVPRGEFDFVCVRPRPKALLDQGICDSFLVRMAERGGRFGALQVIPLHEAKKVTANLLRAWLCSAFLQGASGVLLESWPDLKGNPDLLRATSEVARLAEGAPWATLAPKPSGAVLFEPFSPGVFVEGEGGFGFVRQFGEGDPVQLLRGLGAGTPFGPLDFLSLEEVESPKGLSRYPVIFCPMALVITPQALQALAAYVEAGGVVCADLGFGGYDSVDGTALYPPAPVLDFLGVGAPEDVLDRPGGFMVAWRHPLFPSLPPWASTRPDAFPPPMTIVTMGLQTVAYGLVHPGLRGTYWPDLAGVTIAQRGLGFVVYATMRLWANWEPTDPVFEPFHLDLLRRGANFEALGALGAEFGGRIVLWRPPGRTWPESAEVSLPFRPELPERAWALVYPGQRAVRGRLRVLVSPTGPFPEVLRFLPVWAEPVQGPAYVTLERCDGKGVSIVVSALGPLTLLLAVEVREGGPYPVEEGSRHEVLVLDSKGRRRARKEVVAHAGALRFTVRLRRGTIEVRPLK